MKSITESSPKSEYALKRRPNLSTELIFLSQTLLLLAIFFARKIQFSETLVNSVRPVLADIEDIARIAKKIFSYVLELTFLLILISITLVSSSDPTFKNKYPQVLAFFHLSEYIFQAFMHSKVRGIDSFILNTHWIYSGLHTISLLLPHRSSHNMFSGLTYMAILLRTVCQVWLARDFLPIVICKQPRWNSYLITTGPTGIVRHPSYILFCSFAFLAPLTSGQYLTSILHGILAIFFCSRRAAIEDSILKERWGVEWENWAENIPSGFAFLNSMVCRLRLLPANFF